MLPIIREVPLFCSLFLRFSFLCFLFLFVVLFLFFILLLELGRCPSHIFVSRSPHNGMVTFFVTVTILGMVEARSVSNNILVESGMGR